MFQRIKSLLEEHEWIIPSGLFILFMGFSLPSISWGAPNGWHPDEIVYIAIRALQSDYDFDASNFNHPHLPIYAMFGLGKMILALGQTQREVLIAARVLSASLAGLTVVLAYFIPRRMGYSAIVSGLSGLLLLANNELVHNGHFVHNDTFVTFFTALTIFLLVLYQGKGQRGWLYAAFFSTGLAVSSKYSAV
ncbi:MAG: phospholipid carrier-dependent glycosyltransferase, partial [Anaerolineales bacterium]|nr:phospholipid carrier-dependent glycosyltransferase [Anaerolineales bacterium]